MQMFQIGLISDTHGYFDPRLKEFFSGCQEIWHAGDIGSEAVAEEISAFRTLRAVYGNIDGAGLRSSYPGHQRFEIGGVRVWITHIGGYPGNYAPGIKEGLRTYKPGLFISGHSHILKVIPDKEFNLLYINPGAIGRNGFHTVRTAVRFILDNGKVKELDVLELPRR
jgi:putative phosphoesterase